MDAAPSGLNQWLAALPDHRFGDIAIRPFSHETDGLLEEFEEVERAELYPDYLGFYEP